MKNQRSLYVPFLIVLFVGLMGGGSIVFVGQKMTDLLYGRSDQQSEISPIPQTLTAFQLHYVNQGGRFARIPLTYCNPDQPDASMTPYCGIEQSFLEVDLKIDPLPVEKIQSAITNGNGVVFYAVDSGKKFSNGCVFPDLYLYNLEKHEEKQLKNDPSMWHCGAASSHLSTTSPGGRYVFIVTSGASGGYDRWGYDLERDQIDPELTHARLVTIFSMGEDAQSEDRYALYLDACPDFDDSCKRAPSIKIRNNLSGKIAEIKSLEILLKKKQVDVTSLQGMRYSLQDGSLSVWGEGLGTSVIIPDFREQVKSLVD